MPYIIFRLPMFKRGVTTHEAKLVHTSILPPIRQFLKAFYSLSIAALKIRLLLRCPEKNKKTTECAENTEKEWNSLCDLCVLGG
jgi:hypothetical protein